MADADGVGSGGPAVNARVLLVVVAKAGAVLLAIVAMFGFVVAVYGRLWPSAAIFAAGTVPPLWFLWHNRGPERRRRVRREGSRTSGRQEHVES